MNNNIKEEQLIEETQNETPVVAGPNIDYSYQLEQIQTALSQIRSHLTSFPTLQGLDEMLKTIRDEEINNTQSILRQVEIIRQQSNTANLESLLGRINQQQQAIEKISVNLSALSAMLKGEPQQNAMLENMQFNINQIAQNLSLAMNYEQLRRENEAYRADTNMKNFRRYGIDGLIKLYTNICARIFQIEKGIEEDTAETLDINTLRWMLRRIERQFKPLGIVLEKADTLDQMDETCMELYGDDEDESLIIVPTSNPANDHKVERCVVPAFVWTIPSVTSAPGQKWYLQPQKVCIYRYSDPNNSQKTF